MGFFGWIFYILFGIILYFVIELLYSKFELSRIDKVVASNVFLVIISGILYKYSIRYTENIFLIFVFMLLTDIIYNTYVVNRDFFDKNKNNISFYSILIISGFIINQEFINQVNRIFLTGEEFRIVFWLLIIVYLYIFFKNSNIIKSRDTNKFMSINNILNNYSRFKYIYYDECNVNNKDISNILYSIMIYENNRRNKLLRCFDNIMFKINSKKTRLGIMQVESKKFISDVESIDLVYKKILKIYDSNKTKNIDKIIDKYYGYSNEDVKYIYEIIKKF